MDIVRNRKGGKIKPKIQPEEKHIEKLIENGNLNRQEGDGESSDTNDEKKGIDQSKTEIPQMTATSTNEIICRISCEVDLISISLFLLGLLTRLYKLQELKHIV